MKRKLLFIYNPKNEKSALEKRKRKVPRHAHKKKTAFERQ